MMRKVHCHLHPLIFLYTLLFIWLSLHFIPTRQTSFKYSYFKNEEVAALDGECSEQERNICLHGNAGVDEHGGIDLTTRKRGKSAFMALEYKGAAVYSQPIQLWNKQTNKTASFTSDFSFSIRSTKGFATGGLAFFISRFPYEDIADSGGGYLGLVSKEHAFHAHGHHTFVAVELDTKSDKWDPIKSHVGIDVNSIESVKDKILPGNLLSSDGRVRVDYDSINSNLTVSVDYKSSTILSLVVDLKTILPENVSIGFIATAGSMTDVHTISSWSFSSTFNGDEEPDSPGEQSKSKSTNTGLVVGVVIGMVLLICLLGLIWFFLKRKIKKPAGKDKDKEVDVVLDDEFEDERGPRKFSYHELEKATDNFNGKRKLGEGGFGPVYSGFLKDLNLNVAVKKVSGHSQQGRKEYIAEVKIISQLRHKNLVQLNGWCHQKDDLLLVYELMENGSLDSFIFDVKKSLSWPLRYTIAKGLASALFYLHEEWKQCVVHRDVKASNVMLDKSFVAKLGDFGLARLSDHGGGVQTTFLAGTMGYMAPECFITGKGSKESDVYSFGIVALETACGRKCIDHSTEESKVRLVEWVWNMYGSGRLLDVVDGRLLTDEDFNEQQVQQLLMVGLWCAHPDLEERPFMSHAIAILNFQGSMPNLPMKMPVPSFANKAPIEITATHEASMDESYKTNITGTSNTSFRSPTPLLLTTR